MTYLDLKVVFIAKYTTRSKYTVIKRESEENWAQHGRGRPFKLLIHVVGGCVADPEGSENFNWLGFGSGIS